MRAGYASSGSRPWPAVRLVPRNTTTGAVASTAADDDGGPGAGAGFPSTGPQPATAAIIREAATRASGADHNFSRARAVERGVRVSLLRCAALTKTYAS